MRKGWEVKKLGEVCAFDKQQGSHSNLPYVGLEHIESNTGRFLGVLDAVSVKSSTFHFSPKHVLYGRLRPYLNKVLLPDFEGHCSTEIFPIKPGNGLSREFLFYWLTQDVTAKAIDATSTGARMPRANMNVVLDFKIPVPPLPEQSRIVAILDEAFEGISSAVANAEKNLANARELFESYLNSVFTQKGEGWVEKPLSALAEIKHGFAFKSEYFTNEGRYVLLTPGNFYEEGGYRDRWEKQKFYAGDIPDGYILNQGDFLIAMTEQAAGLLGSSIIVPEDDKFLHNQRLGLVSVKSGAPWVNEFFFHAFNTKRFRRVVHDGASGVKVRHTSPNKLGLVKVRYPLLISEQKRIAASLDDVLFESRRLEVIYQRKLDNLAALKQSILRKAFAGELTGQPEQVLKEAVA
jgi:type I restriction enzyme S subunit